MSDKYDPIRRIFEEVDARIANSRWIATAIVKEVRKEDRAVKVAILPELVETNWIKVYWPNAGQEYMSGQLPEKDTEVVCLFIGGDPNAVFILAGGFLEKDDTPPELIDDHALPIYDKFGNSIVLDSNGITIVSSKDININVNGDAKVTSSGKTTIEASTIELGEGAAESVIKGDAFKTLYNAHTHPTGVGPSGPPVVPMATELSMKVKTV